MRKRKTLATLLLLGATLFNPLKATAEEIKPKPVIERTLEQKASKPKVEINVNYQTGSKQERIDYQTSKSTIHTRNGIYVHSTRDSNVPELTLDEENQVKKIIKDIQNQNINSSQDLITASQNLSENQKLLLSSIRIRLFYRFNYDIDLAHNEVISQEESFDISQNSLISNKKIGLGACGQITTHIERDLNELGIKSHAVATKDDNGIGHTYVISKIENGTAIIDEKDILMANTKNIEKTLGAYQKYKGMTVFQHLFFEDALFKYKLITKDGKNFLDFIEYDESSEPLKNILLEDLAPQADLKINVNLKDFLTSVKFNLSGFFVKAGKIKGDSSSPLKNMNLIQAGFKRDFSFPNIMDIKSELSFIHGSLSQDTELEDNRVYGINGDLNISTEQDGVKLGLRAGGDMISTKMVLFYDLVLGIGTSYKIPIKNMITIEPYVVSQVSLFTEDLGTQKHTFKPAELNVGTVFELKTPKVKVSIEPHYLKRIWEQGFGVKIGLEGKNFGINAEGFTTKSNDEFCPDKYGSSISSYVILKNFILKASGEIEGTNYDGERENQFSFHAQIGFKFNPQ